MVLGSMADTILAILCNMGGDAALNFISYSFKTYEKLIEYLTENPAEQFSVREVEDGEGGSIWFYSSPDPNASLVKY